VDEPICLAVMPGHLVTRNSGMRQDSDYRLVLTCMVFQNSYYNKCVVIHHSCIGLKLRATLRFVKTFIPFRLSEAG